MQQAKEIVMANIIVEAREIKIGNDFLKNEKQLKQEEKFYQSEFLNMLADEKGQN